MEPKRQSLPFINVSEDGWEEQRMNITELYMHHTLNEVMGIMRERHRFQAR